MGDSSPKNCVEILLLELSEKEMVYLAPAYGCCQRTLLQHLSKSVKDFTEATSANGPESESDHRMPTSPVQRPLLTHHFRTGPRKFWTPQCRQARGFVASFPVKLFAV